jgi:hypothetical protein
MSAQPARVTGPLVWLMFWGAAWVAALLLPTVAAAHESQPGLLELRQLAEDRWEVAWRAPTYYGKPHPARLELPSDWRPVAEPTVRQLADSALHRQVVALNGTAFDGSLIRLPGLEATITDVFFLGPELVRVWRGQTSFTIRHPWVLAFGFGPLHGFGFASGLSTVGMPRAEIPLALAMFNVGVELGQLAFVALIPLGHRAARVLEFQWPRPAELAPAYLIGSLGAYWSIQRTAMML